MSSSKKKNTKSQKALPLEKPRNPSPKKGVSKPTKKPTNSKAVVLKKKPASEKGKATLAEAKKEKSKQSVVKPQVKPAAKTKTSLKSVETKPKKVVSAPKEKRISTSSANPKLTTQKAKAKPEAPKLKQEKKAIPSKSKKNSDIPSVKPAEVRPAKPEKMIPKPSAKKASEPIPPPSNTKPEIVAKIRMAQAEKELRKDLAQPAGKTSLMPLTPVPPVVKGKDRLIMMVRDPYWLHVHWDITRHTVDRAKASLAEHWHTVKPILRLLKMDDSGTTSNAETVFRDIEIHGGVRNWYIEVDSPPGRFRVLMGYLTAAGRFFELARSNTVLTPVPGGKEATDDHWADIATDAEHIYAMSGGYGDDTQTGDLTEVFEERLKRTMDVDVMSQFGSGAEGSLKRHKHFHFDVDAELVVFGSTHPDAHVSVGSEPVKVRSDGSFSIRMPLPDRRQVLPATASSRDGVDQQTVVIAVERNTKVMEPLSIDNADDL